MAATCQPGNNPIGWVVTHCLMGEPGRESLHRGLNPAIVQTFCKANALLVGDLVPVDIVLAYCVHMHRVGLAHSTIAGQLAAIMFEAKASGFPDLCSNFRVQKSLEGWAKASVKSRDTRLPVKHFHWLLLAV